MKLPLLRLTGSDEPSFTTTAAALALGAVLVKTVMVGVVVAGVQLGTAPDAGVIAALLTPTLGAYVIRRGQEK